MFTHSTRRKHEPLFAKSTRTKGAESKYRMYGYHVTHGCGMLLLLSIITEKRNPFPSTCTQIREKPLVYVIHYCTVHKDSQREFRNAINGCCIHIQQFLVLVHTFFFSKLQHFRRPMVFCNSHTFTHGHDRKGVNISM